MLTLLHVCRRHAWQSAVRFSLLQVHLRSLPAARSLHQSIGRYAAQTSSPTAQDAGNGVQDIRNIGIIAHVDAGKTTTTELLLYSTGLTRHFGRVDHGDTVTDFLALERERGITIQSAAITLQWPRPESSALQAGRTAKTINLIDTPGHQDFRFEVDRCLPVLDGAVCILDGVKGVETHTERVWASARRYEIPRIVLVNKLDRDGASFRRSVLDVAAKLGAWPLVCQIPWWEGDDFVGVVDVLDGVGMRWQSANLKAVKLQKGHALWEEVQRARTALIEALCDRDEELMEAFLEHEKALPTEMIKKSVRRLINDGRASVVPVLAGASLRGMGAEPLLDAIADYLPSPLDRPDLEIQVATVKRSLVSLLHDNPPSTHQKHHRAQGAMPKSPIAGLAVAFKVVNDPQRGMLTFVRVYHGTLARNAPMWNSTRQTFEKSLNMLHIAGAKTQDIPSLSVGGIGALTGLKEARTGDTLVMFAGNPSKAPESLRGISIRPPEIPPAVAFVAIYPHTVTGSKALATALESASREDPSLRWTHDDRLDRFVLSGLGTLHLDICQDRLKTFYKVDAEFGKIEVDYKESLTVAQPPLRYVFDGIVAGKAGSAACTATLEPLPRDDEGNEIAGIGVDSTRDGNVIEVFVASEAADAERRNEDVDTDLLRQQLFNGALAALSRGPLRGSPLHGLKVKLDFDPATDMLQPSTGAHVVGAATQAVRRALKEALNKGEMMVMEPFMKVLIQVPEDVGGAVEHDLAANRGGLVLEVNDLSRPQAEARPSQTQGRFHTNIRPTSNNQAADADDADMPIDLSKVYIPPDPYESVQTLREAKRGAVRMLEIVARVPLREVLEYDGHLRSVTAGRHSLHMELDQFEVSRKG